MTRDAYLFTEIRKKGMEDKGISINDYELVHSILIAMIAKLVRNNKYKRKNNKEGYRHKQI